MTVTRKKGTPLGEASLFCCLGSARNQIGWEENHLGGTRTLDLEFRRFLLYPTELPGVGGASNRSMMHKRLESGVGESNS